MRMVRAFASWFNTKFKGHLPCPVCGRSFPRETLSYKRLLSRGEAELLERSTSLSSHFVYTCPTCGSEIVDVKLRKGSNRVRKTKRFL
jgi:endogenous inhibitor of DNA gyrase (YacG/DUF329 family)